MPFYDVPAVAEAVGMDEKQLDNLLSRNELTGVERRTRGVSRRLSVDAAVTIQLASDLATVLGMPIGHALRVSRALQESESRAIRVGTFATLQIDLPALRAATLTRLDAAVELVGRRKRGRPPRGGTAALAAQE